MPQGRMQPLPRLLVLLIWACSVSTLLSSSGLPPNWVRLEHQGRAYFANTLTNATQWDPPTAAPPVQHTAIASGQPIATPHVQPATPMPSVKRLYSVPSSAASAPATGQPFKTGNLAAHSAGSTVQIGQAQGGIGPAISGGSAAAAIRPMVHRQVNIMKTANVEDNDADLDIEESELTPEDRQLHAEAAPADMQQAQDQQEEEDEEEEGEQAQTDDDDNEETNDEDVNTLRTHVHDLKRQLLQSSCHSLSLEEQLASAQNSIDSTNALVEELESKSKRYLRVIKSLKAANDKQKADLVKAADQRQTTFEEQGKSAVPSTGIASVDEAGELDSDIDEEEEEEEEGNVDSRPASRRRFSILSNILSKFYTRGHTEKDDELTSEYIVVAQLKENATALAMALENRNELIQELLAEMENNRQTTCSKDHDISILMDANGALQQKADFLSTKVQVLTEAVTHGEQVCQDLRDQLSFVSNSFDMLQAQYQQVDSEAIKQMAVYSLYLLHVVRSLGKQCDDQNILIESLNGSIQDMKGEKLRLLGQLHNTTVQLAQQMRLQAVFKVEAVTNATDTKGGCCILRWLRKWW